ncbi:uncharacterized protein LOC122230196 [Panthera leo]|uniref:uncharacterized protein LOC122230196 n=1 Tax=Panthera leo TaxID=9689 RepID=UPI001C696E83|nr:uncharacterized protein LOC122230196 [Panthera leo]
MVAPEPARQPALPACSPGPQHSNPPRFFVAGLAGKTIRVPRAGSSHGHVRLDLFTSPALRRRLASDPAAPSARPRCCVFGSLKVRRGSRGARQAGSSTRDVNTGTCRTLVTRRRRAHPVRARRLRPSASPALACKRPRAGLCPSFRAASFSQDWSRQLAAVCWLWRPSECQVCLAVQVASESREGRNKGGGTEIFRSPVIQRDLEIANKSEI